MALSRKRKKSKTFSRRPAQDSPTLTHRKERLQRLVFGVSFVVLVAAITEFPLLGSISERYKIDNENVASETVRAAFGFEAEDLNATEQKREEAAATVADTYNVDMERVQNTVLTLQQRIRSINDRRPEVEKAIHESLVASVPDRPVEAVVDEVLTQLTNQWKEDPLLEGFPSPGHLRLWITPKLESLPKRVQTETDDGPTTTLDPAEPGTMTFVSVDALNTIAINSMRYILTAGVRQSGALSADRREAVRNVIILRSETVDDLRIKEERSIAGVPDIGTARTNLRSRITEEARLLAAKSQETDQNWDAMQEAAFEMARPVVTDTLYYNGVNTEGDKELARNNVEPITVRYYANQVLQEDGQPWDDQSRHATRTYWALLEGGSQSSRSIVGPILSNMLFISLLLLALHRAVPAVSSRRASAYKGVNIILLITCVTLVMGRIVKYFDPSGFVVPAAASVILITILTNARLAAVSTALIGVLLSIQYQQSWELLAVVSAMSFTGVMSLYRVRKRGDMASASVRATLIGIVTVLALALSTGSLQDWEMLLKQISLVLLNGLFCLFLVPGLLSPLERLFGVTTDIQLLEYSDLNNELLSRLAIEIPATYAHSLMLGQLAEAAADAIGANGLMTRVSAYYHDIGKLRRPEYFSENQTGYNIHEDISPRLSARAIASHVTEGVEMAREYHLPQPIIRGILEHHGTSLISFFYQQALDQQKHGDVREEDFRYPGPRPQSPETAILMICDAVESGARTIKNLNEERLREFIDKIIQSRSEDRQFDECDLTLKKLDTIGDVLTKRLMTTMHTRIAYPERRPQPEADNVIRMTGGRDS